MRLALGLLLQLFSPVDPAAVAQLHEERIERLGKAHGAEAAETRAARRELGLFWLRNERPAEAERQLRLAQPDAQAAPYLAEAVAAQRGREAEAEALFAACRPVARCSSRLAQLAERRGDGKAALALYREALDSEPTGTRRNDLAQALQAAGQMKEAEALFRVAAREQESQLGPNHPETATTWNNLASLLAQQDRMAEAEPWQRRAYVTMQKTLGPRHVRTGLSASNLADILRARGRETEARKLYRRALAIFEEELGPGHPWTAEARAALQP